MKNERNVDTACITHAKSLARQASSRLANVNEGTTMTLPHDGRVCLDWRKARRSMNNGNCVEVAAAIGMVAVRDTKDQQGPMVQYSISSWRSFIAAAKRGDFDPILR